jgi:hypothetical protein
MRRLTRSETNSGMMLSGEEDSGSRRFGRQHLEQTLEFRHPNLSPRTPTLCKRMQKVAAPADQLVLVGHRTARTFHWLRAVRSKPVCDC